jgi:YfiH family protein
MAAWKRQLVGDMPLYQASTISWLPKVIQGFTTRNGGISQAPYESLNLSYLCGDDAQVVTVNRERLATSLDVDLSQMVFAEQIHGAEVGLVDRPSPEPVEGVDALVTRTPGIVLSLLFADCLPVYVVDPMRRVVGLAHSGWRGTAANIVQRMTDVLVQRFDCVPRMCQVAIGPGIAGENYEVGMEVADRFRGSFSSTAAVAVVPKSEVNAKYELHLRRIVFNQLLAAGYRPDSIAVCEEDTFRNSRDFFSVRRDCQGSRQTGRMAAVLGIR